MRREVGGGRRRCDCFCPCWALSGRARSGDPGQPRHLMQSTRQALGSIPGRVWPGGCALGAPGPGRRATARRPAAALARPEQSTALGGPAFARGMRNASRRDPGSVCTSARAQEGVQRGMPPWTPARPGKPLPRSARANRRPLLSLVSLSQRTLNHGRVLDVPDGGRVHDVADNEALDGLVLGDQDAGGLTAHALDLWREKHREGAPASERRRLIGLGGRGGRRAGAAGLEYGLLRLCIGKRAMCGWAQGLATRGRRTRRRARPWPAQGSRRARLSPLARAPGPAPARGAPTRPIPSPAQTYVATPFLVAAVRPALDGHGLVFSFCLRGGVDEKKKVE